MDEKQIKLLWDLDAKNGGFSSYDEFRTLMQNDNARKAYFDASNKDLGFKDYDEFETTLGVKKKEGLLSSVGSYGTPSQMGSIVGGAVGTLNGNSQKLNGSNISSVSSTVEQPVNVDDDPVKFALSPYRAAANKALTDLQNVDKSGNESIGSMGDFGIKLDVSRSGLLRDEYNKRAKALNQAEQQSNNLFRTTANAYNYLVKKNEENNGTLPDDNETVNLALKKVSNAQAIDDLWKKTGKYTDANKNFENFAFNLIEGKNSDNAPEAKRGEYVYETLNDPTVIERASLNPEFNKALRTANANLYNNYPSFANKKIGQDLAQIMEDNKMINALYDNPGTDKTDKAANLLLNEGKWGNREYNYYIKKIRPIVERGDADKIIPLTDIAHQAGYALYEGTKGYNQSMRDAINFLGGNFLDKNGNSLWQNLGLLESNQSEQQRKEQEKYATPFAKPKGVKAYIESPINMAAGIAPMILGGMVGVPSSVNMALQFGSGNAEKANDIFPGNDIKSRSNRFAYTLASTSIDMTLMDLLPINKLLEAKRALEPTIRGTIRSLANGEISRAEVKPLLLDKLGNYLKTVPKNLIENANVLTAYNYAHAGLGALAGDRNIKAEEIGQNLIGDYLNNLLAGSALSLLHFKPGDKPRFEEAQYLRFANNYGAYKTALENRLKEHPEESQSINEKLDNLLYLKNVKDGMNPDMSDKKKARLLTISLKEKVLNDAKRAMPDKDLFDNSKIDELKKQKEEVLNTEEKPEEKVEPTESRETSKMPQTDDEWKESIATAPDEATKDELMKKHGEWIIAQKKVSDKVKSKLSEFKLEEEPEAKGEGETEIKGQAVPDEASNPSIQSAVINVGGKQYEGKNHAEAILKAKADGQDISSIDRQAEGKFKLSDGTIIDRNEAMQKFGNDKAELLIPQDEVAKQADKDYAKEIKNNSNLDKTQEDVKLAKHPTEHELAISKLPEEALSKPNTKETTPTKEGNEGNSALRDVESKKADIERRRQEELNKLEPYKKLFEDVKKTTNSTPDSELFRIANKAEELKIAEPENKNAFVRFKGDKHQDSYDTYIKRPEKEINAKYDAELAALEETSGVSGSALKDVETKQQIENFGVPKEDVEATHGLLNQVFSGLKKAGLTAAKTVGDWVGIGKGEANPNSLDGIVEAIQKTLPKVENKETVKEQPKTESEIPTWIAEFERTKTEKDLVKMEELYNKIKVVQNGVLQGRIKDPIVLEKTIKQLNDLKKQIEDYAENWKKEAQPKVSGVTETDTKKQPINKIEDLQDVGEKIGGAKKDLAQKLSEVTTEDLATKPLSKVFPKPDFKKLVEEGSLSEDGAILLNFLYEKIPAKPRKQYRVANWVKTVDSALQTTRQVLEAESTKNLDFTDKILKAVTLSETLKRDYKLYSDTMKGLGFPKNDVNLGGYEIKKFENRSKFNKETGKLEPVKGEVYSIVSGSSIIGDFKTMDDAVNGLKTILNKSEEKTKGTKFDIYQDRKTKEFFIGKKGAIDVVRVMQGFKTLGEARNFLKEKQSDIQGLWDAMKAPKERRMANRPRVGADWRKGKNVDSKEFADTFGFRGVEFGNWVNNAERQSHVNEAYDALMDLSSVLGVSPKALSLNGELGFAFGARGSGKANAHYEAGKVVINLTKTRGAGSLAHEWWHALDNYFSRNRGQKESFITQSPRDRIERDGSRNQGVRKEMIDAFKSVMDAIESTKLSERSKVLDRARSDAYWSTNIEMSARSFENYIIEKLGERNQQNDYLANFKETAEWINDTKGDIDALKNYPYPLAEESPIVNEKFQQFFETIKEDENAKLFKDAEAQYRIESGKNIIEAIKDFNQSKNKARATVALTHEIMHPTVVSIIDGAKEGNEVGVKHTETIVNEFNKANPNSKVTVEDLIKGNDAFKDGTTSKQYRQVQEFIAKAWEKYHTEGGKGFSEAFQKVLDQITKAFQSVYKSITGKQLTPELKQMFDDILGKEAPTQYTEAATPAKKETSGVSGSALRDVEQTVVTTPPGEGNGYRDELPLSELLDNDYKHFDLGDNLSAVISGRIVYLIDKNYTDSKGKVIAEKIYKNDKGSLSNINKPNLEIIAKAKKQNLEDRYNRLLKAKVAVEEALSKPNTNESTPTKEVSPKAGVSSNSNEDKPKKIQSELEIFPKELSSSPTVIHKSKNNFKILTPDGIKNVSGQKVDLEGYNNLDLFIHRESTKTGKGGDYVLTEERTGLEMGRGDTAKAAAERGVEVLKWQQSYNKDFTPIYEQVNRHIDKSGTVNGKGRYEDTPIPKISSTEKVKILESKLDELNKEIVAKKKEASRYLSSASTEFEQNFIDRINKRIKEINNEGTTTEVSPKEGVSSNSNEDRQTNFHTTESESPKLAQMKDIVKDLVDEGYTNLSDIHEIVARETKNDSPKLKQLVTDAYNEYGKEKENTSTEVTSGVIGKVSQWLKKVFGEDNPNEPKILSSKDDADFERRVREDAGKEDGDVLFHRGKKPFGGNSGYSGYSMSKRAEQAYEDGKLPYSKLPAWAKRMVDAGLATTDEWHHTSSYGNETPFYNLKQFIPESKAKEHGLIDEYGDVVAGKGFKDISKEVIKELDVQSKEALKKKNNVKAVRKSLIDKAQKELDDFNAKFKRYSRVSKSPEHGITDLSEMNGKYGWFDSSGKSYNLPEYHSGIDYETAENRQKAKVLQKQLSDSKNKPIYEIELGKRGFDDKESNQLKELGIIDSEIMPENFYNTLERNKYIIKEQLKELSELPKPNEKFNPRFKKSLDDFLTDGEKQSRRNRHNYISEQGEDFGSSYERRLAHEENDGEYNKIASERYDKAKEDYLNSDEVKKDEIEFNEQKQKAQKIVNNINELFNKNDSDVLFHKSPEGKILGATVNGKIYLNGNHINPNTPIHEAGHIWVEVAKQHTPEIYDRGIKLVSDADNPYMKKVKSNEFYKSEASKAGKEGSPEYEQYMQHEALAMAIGDKGAQFVTEAKKSAFKEWLSNLWDMVKKAAGFKDITTEELQNLTFDEFTKRAARDILQGEVPEKESGGIRHADTKIIRERHGFEPYEKKPQTEEQWEQEAERRIKENPDAVNELLDRIDKSQRNEELGLPSKLDTDEADQKILDIHVNKLDKELQSNPSPEKLQELRRAVSLADYSGTKLGRELRSRRSSGLPMDSLGQFLLNKENAQGANLTGKQVIEQSEKYKELKKAHDEFKEAYEKEKSERERLQIENEILKKGGKGSGIKKSKSDYVTERKSLVELLKKQKQEHEKWLEEQGIQRMGFGITLTTDMAKTILKIAKSYAEEGVDKLETLVDKVGEAIKDVFPEITNSDIMDVLGNRNKTQDHEKTKAEYKNLLKSLRKEAELIRKIADARKGIEKEKNERTIAQKTKRIQELEEQYNKIKSSNEKEFSEEDLQNSLMDRIRKVKHDLKTKEFLKEKTKNKVNIFEKMSPKTTKMQDQLIELQIKRDVELYKDQLSKRTKWQKGWDIIQQALGIKRLVQTSIDVSLLGRQLVTVTKNPRRWMHVPKIVRGTLSSFANPKVFNRIMFNIKSDPDYQLMLKDGLHFIEFESPDVERRSDLFPMKNFLYNFPYARVPLLASNRAADAAANIARYELYKQGERRLLNQKITRENHPEEYEGLARWVNTITGSGKMLKFIEESHGLKKFLGNTLYGAKLMASRFNMLSPKYWAKLPPAVKREAIKDMISFTGTLMAMGIAARAAGARVSLNPNDSEFLKIRIGNKVYDITGGIGNYVRMFLRLSGLIMSRGKYLTGNMSKQENARNIDRGLTSLNTFIQSKLAPNTSFAISALTGKNAIGQPFDPYDALRVYPMYIDDIIDGFNDSGFTSLFTVLLPSLEGEGVNVYPSRDANYSQEFKDNPVIKYYTEEWGMQLPNVRLKNQKIPNTKKTIDDYPKEKQDEYIKAHNNELLKVLTYIKDRGYVYKSEEGDISLYGNPGDEQIRLDDLKDDWDKAQVMSLAQGRASLLAKRKVFGR